MNAGRSRRRRGFSTCRSRATCGAWRFSISAVAVGKATATPRPPRRERPAPERKVAVVGSGPEAREHYVDGELVRR